IVLGLARVGLAVTAGTYATVGAAAPARVGLTVVKAARKTGRLGGAMAAWINRSLREVVDWTALKRAINSASIAEPAADARRARGGQDRKGARTCAARRRRGTRAGSRWNARGARRIEA